jgi:hypothetical protein
MNQLSRGGFILTLALSVPALAAEPDPSTRAAARKIATDGVGALQQGNAELASQKLEKAFELLPAPSIALWSARALAKRGLLVEASERYLQAGRLPSSEGNEQAVQAQAQQDAARELAELGPRIPKLVIAVDGAPPSEVSLELDGKALSSALVGEEQPANPGAHKLTGTRGAERVEQSFSLAEAQTSKILLHFQQVASPAPGAPLATAPLAAPPLAAAPSSSEAPSSPSGRSNTLAYVALAVGGAGIATGAITGAIALGKRGDLDDNPACNDGRCLPSVRGDVDSFRTMRTISSIGFIAGGVCAGAGVVLLLTGGSSSKKAERATPAMALRMAPGNVSVTGTF